jgi:hypothetical protein
MSFKYILPFIDFPNTHAHSPELLDNFGNKTCMGSFLRHDALEQNDPDHTSPDGAGLSAEAYANFWDLHNLEKQVRQILVPYYDGNVEVKETGLNVRQLIASFPFPKDVENELDEYIDFFSDSLVQQGRPNRKFVARSSAPKGEDENKSTSHEEDGKTIVIAARSGAGLHESKTSLTRETFKAGVHYVWDYMFSDGALHQYKLLWQETGIMFHLLYRMSVCIMEQANTKNTCSGIGYTWLDGRVRVEFIKGFGGNVEAKQTSHAIIFYGPDLHLGPEKSMISVMPGEVNTPIYKFNHIAWQVACRQWRLTNRVQFGSDFEWGEDGTNGPKSTYQHRANLTDKSQQYNLKTYELTEEPKAPPIAVGLPVGGMIVTGEFVTINSAEEINNSLKGKIVGIREADPEMRPLITAVTEFGGVISPNGSQSGHFPSLTDGNCAFAAAVKGYDDLVPGKKYTLACEEGGKAKIYEGELPHEVDYFDLTTLPETKTEAYLISADPNTIWEDKKFFDVGLIKKVVLSRIEQLGLSNDLMSLFYYLYPDQILDPAVELKLRRQVSGYDPEEYWHNTMLRACLSQLRAAGRVDFRFSDERYWEYKHNLLPKKLIPVQYDQSSGYHGARAYVYLGEQNAGLRMLDANCRLMLGIKDAGFAKSVNLFIPQLGGEKELEFILERMKDNGVHSSDFAGLKVMSEVPSMDHDIPKFPQYGVTEICIGTNDSTKTYHDAARDLGAIAAAINVVSEGSLEMWRYKKSQADKAGLPTTTCGKLQLILVPHLVSMGFKGLGFGRGLSAVRGIELMAETERSMSVVI